LRSRPLSALADIGTSLTRVREALAFDPSGRVNAGIFTDELLTAPAASPEVLSWSGRLVPSDDMLASEFQEPGREAVSAYDLVNLWECDSMFDGYVVSNTALPGLTVVESRPPVPNTVLNWLNVFYALEWMAFGGFALYFWYRLVKDAVERELEALAETQP
jgi:hypothetical protein